MGSPPNITNITPPRVPIIDDRTGLISREWYRFFLNLFTLTGNGSNTTSLTDLQVGPPVLQIEDVHRLIAAYEAANPTQESAIEQIAELQKQVDGLSVQPREELGTMAALQQDNVPWLKFDTTPQGFPTGTAAAGSLYWDDADGIKTLNLVMEDSGGVIQQIGEEMYYRIKADAAITNGQVVMFTGTVGASGALKGAPATGLTAFQNEYIMGVATQDIAHNGWGYVTWFGLVRGINTTGGAEAWTDGQVLYYDPSVPGGLTKNVPTAPNPKVIVASVVNAASNGSLFVRPSFGSALGSTDSNVQIGTLANGNLLIYNASTSRWENATLTAGTNVSITNGPGSITINSSNPGGTVTSVNASGGTTGLTFTGGPITSSGTLTLSGTLAATNGGTGLTSLGTGVATWLGAPSSANLAAAVTDETGSGSLVFATSPALTTPTADGLTVGKGASTLSANTAFGVSALAAVTSGNGSTAIGYQALKSITSTGGATAVGYQAGTSLVTGGVQTTLVGYAAGLNLTNNYNTAVGTFSLQGAAGSATGQFNTAVGVGTGQVIQSGNNNALFGIYVGVSLTSGSANAAFGGNASANAAGSALTTGSSNSLFGNTAGGVISTGSKNSVFGNYTGNQGGLDIRTKSNYIVLSNGDGVPQQVINPQGTQEFSQGTGKFPKFEGFFGWSNVSSVTQDLATLFPDVTFTNGAVSLVLQILSGSTATNSGSTIYNVVRQTNGTWTSGLVSSVTGGITITSVTGSGTSITINFLAGNQYGYCNVSGLVLT